MDCFNDDCNGVAICSQKPTVVEKTGKNFQFGCRCWVGIRWVRKYIGGYEYYKY